ncbi:hypothetical protein HYS50_03040 [Candidatus Woesearchaeota archaeon]|nr:hypothetical protein [Candidatus Woesearchaeota archaeon]
MKLRYTILIIFLLLFVTSCTQITPTSEDSEEKVAIGGELIKKDIESPHPYPNSKEGTKLVWSSTLEHPKATSLRLHVKKMELRSYSKWVNKGETEVRGIIIYPNTLELIPDVKLWSGDYLILKDSRGTILQIIGGACPHNESLGYEDSCTEDGFWLPTIYDNKITLELYADEKENAYGLSIDKYLRGFTPEEADAANRKDLEKQYKECEKQGIPRNECPILK